MDLIQTNGSVKMVDLAKQFNVSRETIRRDILSLSNTGKVKKLFGTVISENKFTIPTVNSRIATHRQEKEAIAKKAVSLLPEHCVLYIDAGSTALAFARELKQKSGYTILTNSFPVVNELNESKNKLIFIGGSVDNLTMATTGTQALDFINKIKLNVVILGTSGFLDHHGPTSNSLDDFQIKTKLIEDANIAMVLTDSSKANESALVEYADWNNIRYLITDAQLSKSALNEIQKKTDIIQVTTLKSN
ncbi:DeoR family transcriptional regulator [Lactobacillus selangorensis]|uniref:DeoR family transcriptional regulator n=2 Tax=Lactobacillus selangorensis TaxID=81857 RepID=A0A0R2FRI5_9LACO|nr:DeoR family transcriptional regulator [Lactobacillus selangorensis]KRN30522.1 DeoR family transcriptional regulator [Lactobacillus selangorensis]